MGMTRTGKPGTLWRKGEPSAFVEGKEPRLYLVVHFGTACIARKHTDFKVLSFHDHSRFP